MPKLLCLLVVILTEVNRDANILSELNRGAFYLLKQGLPLDLAVGDLILFPMKNCCA